MNPRTRTARLPPSGLAGLDPQWSSLVTAVDHHGVERTWHVLDTGLDSGSESEGLTVLCVHGNPNWSYMWRGLANALTEGGLPAVRVVAVDALNMGFSERTGGPRRLADHIADLSTVSRALQIEGPVITVAHDWGGPISMGWAQQHVDQLVGIVLMNTGVARPEVVKIPPLISIARRTLRATCEITPTFLHGALRMARPQLTRQVYRGYSAPYGSAELRTGIRDFVEDIPIEDSHESFDTLASVACGLEQLKDIPALLQWGAKDIIFSDAFLADLMRRLPHAEVHRYPDAGHQIIEDTGSIGGAGATDVIQTWINTIVDEGKAPTTHDAFPETGSRIWSAIESRRGDGATAIVEMDAKESGSIARSISFDELNEEVEATARGLVSAGIKPGDRLASLVSPGIDLTVLLYACLRAGIVVVVPDAALGLNGLRRALRSSRPDYVVGDWRGLLLARSLRLPATRLSFDQLAGAAASAEPLPAEPSPGDPAAIVFTSGSTGPSKGVIYTHGQLEAQRDAITQAFGIEPTDRLVVAFAPFAVLAPAIGITSVIPNMDVRAPSKLRADALAHAAKAIDATIVFASPAVLGNIATTAAEVDADGRRALDAIRSVVTAGAPVSPQLLADAQPVFANATISTPYGMTEVLPVTIASAAEIAATGSEAGVCVGVPLPQVDVTIREIGAPSGSLPNALRAGELGEVWVRASHGCTGYDRLWAKQHHAFVDGWHRSGDVGHIDSVGRLWIEGRVDHLIHGPTGILAPVQIELQAESVEGVQQAAAVGVGPIGTQMLAVVVAGESLNSDLVAGPALAAAVRAAVTAEVAAVLVAPAIPVDRRHNSKIDRTRVQKWAEVVLSGRSRARL